MVEEIKQKTDEDDEAFLLRAEAVREEEQRQIEERARHLVAVAVKGFDKPPLRRELEEILRDIVGPKSYVSTRVLLLAWSMCRDQQSRASGPDPVAEDAYQMLSRLALADLRSG